MFIIPRVIIAYGFKFKIIYNPQNVYENRENPYKHNM